jgi:biuret amidohydrolase
MKVYVIFVDSPFRSAKHAASNSSQGSVHPMATAGSSSSKRANELIPPSIGVDHPKAAVIAIDLHRGHLDMAVATMPTLPEVAAKVIAANKRLFDWCRSVGIPVIHQLTSYRDAEEIRANPFWRTRAEDPAATRKNVLRHNIMGGPGCTVMPQLLDPRDFVVNTKKRYDCFLGTDLDFLLRSHGINTLLITGVNTNSCVLATTTAANVRDYAVIVVEDCVDSMDGPELHAAGLACVKTAFGFVMNTDAIMALDELVPRRQSSE